MNYLTINNKELNIEKLTIDFDNNEINIITEDMTSESYSFLFRIILYEKKIDKTLYLKDSNNIYSLYECYLGKHSMKNNVINLTIKFQAYIIGYKINDIKNYKINKLEVRLEYKKYDLAQIEESAGKKLKFAIGNMTYNMELIFDGRYYKVTLENKKSIETEKFIHNFLLFYEYLILNLGYYLEIKEIKIYNEDKISKYYYPFSSKYSGKNNYNSYTSVLCIINKNDIKQNYKNWLKIRKETHNIYDIYMNVFSVKYFIEIALSTITNCMEGYYKCIHKSNLKKIIKDKNSNIKFKNKEFKDIMKEYLNSKEGKLIFSSKDRQTLKIYTKLTNHRNYFAHLNEKKKRFYGDSNLYMLLKIKLLFRVFILKDNKQTIEIDNLKKCVKSIEEDIEWKKRV